MTRLVIGTAITLLLLCACGFNEREQKEAESKVAGSSPAETVSARELFDAYEANEVAADRRFKGKVLRVSGTVQGIEKNMITEQPYLGLETSNQFMAIDCYFARAHEGRLASVSKGQRVTVKGLCDGKTVSVNLKGCVFD